MHCTKQQPQRRAAIVVLALLLLAVCSPLAATEPPAKQAPKTVRLVIAYGDGAELHFTALPWKAEMTVLDALEAAKRHPHGITFTQRGRGTTAMITQIGNLANQGNGKNWLYSVNDKTAEVGAGAYELADGDRILWEFKEYE